MTAEDPPSRPFTIDVAQPRFPRLSCTPTMLSGATMSETQADARLQTGDRPERVADVYFSADVETDGPIPGPYSMLSFALVYAGSFDGKRFERPRNYERYFYKELCPISSRYQVEALKVNGLDRDRLLREGNPPEQVMTEACGWIKDNCGSASPVLVAYPLSFDWSWLYWYFIQFSAEGSPFGYSRCFDIKTALSVKAHLPISRAGRARLDPSLGSNRAHTHHAIGDAIEQAEIFANIFEWRGAGERTL